MNEKDYALRDAAMAKFVDSYFKARPQIPRTQHKETLIEAGFKAAWKPAVLDEWRDVMAGLVGIAEAKGKKHGSPNHSHSRPGIWDDDNIRNGLAGKRCAECEMYDRARALLQSISEEFKPEQFSRVKRPGDVVIGYEWTADGSSAKELYGKPVELTGVVFPEEC